MAQQLEEQISGWISATEVNEQLKRIADALDRMAPSPLPPSADGTLVPPAPFVIDGLGAKWSLSAGVVLRNGVQAAGGGGSLLFWHVNQIYVLGTDANWWQWNGSGWVNIGPTQPS